MFNITAIENAHGLITTSRKSNVYVPRYHHWCVLLNCRHFTYFVFLFLIFCSDSKELEYWVDKINYVAGLLSAPSLPPAVGSDQTFHRPILPASVTHLGVVSCTSSSFTIPPFIICLLGYYLIVLKHTRLEIELYHNLVLSSSSQ